MPKVNHILTPNTLAWELTEGGRRIVLATDRSNRLLEARNMGHSMDYPFTPIEVRL